VHKTSDGRRAATEQTNYTLFNGKGNKDHHSGMGSLLHKRIITVVRTAEFVIDRMSYITLLGCWCIIVVLNLHASCEDKTNDIWDSFYEELECVFLSIS
jgi:hypothetical protein